MNDLTLRTIGFDSPLNEEQYNILKQLAQKRKIDSIDYGIDNIEEIKKINF